MRKTKLKCITFLFFCVLFVLCLVCGCADSNRLGSGTKNKTYTQDVSLLTQPVFSDRGGFYSDNLKLEITIPEKLSNNAKTIRVTFDGSEPTSNSDEYKGSILLPDAGFVKTGFAKKEENVKVSVVRAACFDNNGNVVGQIATATYIQLEESNSGSGKTRFDLPVISLVTDDSNLNSRDYGIFRNTDGRGSEWERPVNVSFFETDGDLAFAQDAGIRLFGGSTRNLTQKSFRITARKTDYFQTDVYDGAGKFKYALFSDRKDSQGNILDRYDSFVLRNGGNDSIFFAEDSSRITFLRDGLAAKITQMAAPEVNTMDYRPVVVFLNGEYYGIMNLREYQNNKYIQNVYGIDDKDGITVISTEMDTSLGGRYDGKWFYYKQDDGPEGELQAFLTLLSDITSGKYTYEQACEKIDMDNFMKYCALNLFLCNTDWPHNNVKLWRYAGNNPGGNADAAATDGKWRFMLKDADLGLGRFVCAAEKRQYPIELYTKADCQSIRFLLANYISFDNKSGYPSVNKNTYPDALKIQGLFYFCMQHDEFADKFYDFCNTLTTQICSYDTLKALIEESYKEIENEFDNYLNKDFGNWPWEGNTTLKQWKSAVCDNKDSLLTWAKARTGFDGEFMKQVTELRDVLNR